MKSVGFGARLGALAAALCMAAPVAMAEGPASRCTPDTAAAMSVAWSRSVDADLGVEWSYAAFRGLSCSACNPAIHYCVVNPVRFEYACAPLGTTACWSSERTGWCRAPQTCWGGVCR